MLTLGPPVGGRILLQRGSQPRSARTVCCEALPAPWILAWLRRAFAANGYDEAINFSFIDTESDEQIEPVPGFIDGGNPDRFVTLRNPIIEDAVRMRQTLLPGLLNSLRHNLNYGERNVRLFEIGRIFAGERAGEPPREREGLAFVASGGNTEEGRAQPSRTAAGSTSKPVSRCFLASAR